MKRKTYLILRIMLPVLGIIIGAVKVFGLSLEVNLFRQFGLPDWFRILFGFAQAASGLFIIKPKFELLGIVSSILLLLIPISFMFYNHMYKIAFVPILGILTLLTFAYSRKA